jgi:hypothetical protein
MVNLEQLARLKTFRARLNFTTKIERKWGVWSKLTMSEEGLTFNMAKVAAKPNDQMEASTCMAKVSWQIVREILEQYEGQTKTVTAMAIVRAFDEQNPRTSMRNQIEFVGGEVWKQ